MTKGQLFSIAQIIRCACRCECSLCYRIIADIQIRSRPVSQLGLWLQKRLVSAWHNGEEATKDQPQFIWSFGGPVYATQHGEISHRNPAPGQYQIITRLFAKYWYLRSINVPVSGLGAKQSSRSIDAVSNWITLRAGDRLSGLVVTVSEGASSLQGQVRLNEGETLPSRLYVYLVDPASRGYFIFYNGQKSIFLACFCRT